ncbi:MAG: hypothetical protein N838_24645 [Thiohalocapsa sp. PB-PSB1]|nr:MAG: hypothetical protein N838_24645 [Thiohalocapsa sp. PB-PSB1]
MAGLCAGLAALGRTPARCAALLVGIMLPAARVRLDVLRT